MDQTIQIRCKNNNISKNISIGSTLLDIYHQFNLDLPYGPVSAKVNGKVEGLSYRAFRNKDVEYQTVLSSSGMRTYVRSLCFVLCKAVHDLFPNVEIRLENPASKGYFFDIRLGRPIELNDIALIKKKMKEIIDADIPFHRIECPTEDAVKLFRQQGLEDKATLLETTGSVYTFYYSLDGFYDYYYGSLLPKTGGLYLYDVAKYYDGILLRIPNRHNPDVLEEIVKQQKMMDVFRENHHWQEIMRITTLGELNKAVLEGHASDIIKVTEALQEKIISKIADEIAEKENVKIVLISGPSSSGKTTFSKRLSIQLMASGKHPYPVSLDNYFINRDETPLDENGNHDFESLYALDLEFFNKQLSTLIKGEEVELPYYNFITGKREFRGEKLCLKDNMILILEGIHALNPELVRNIPEVNKFRVYVSALTSILIDHHNYIPTTDNRLLRRIIRDYKYRGYSAELTISRWPSVRAGEEKWIFPYQENADAMFNSALLYELAVIKDYVEPLLRQVPQISPQYSEAYRLLKFLRYFVPVHDKELPPTSLLREFLGGSSFRY